MFGLVSLNCRLTLLEYFSESFSKKETALSYFFLLLVHVQCLKKTFLYFFFSQSRKILSYFSKLSAILKCRKKNFVVMTSILYLSFNRSSARTNQNCENNLDYCIKAIGKKKPEKIRASMGFEPVTSAITMRCSIN